MEKGKRQKDIENMEKEKGKKQMVGMPNRYASLRYSLKANHAHEPTVAPQRQPKE
ncbi:MAG TPA: hypothetical protein VGQ81_11075 [Acidobacteriota bacterium]|nr:hypothetical protein [Acidobacteriota bacterium]